ncbi:hypothetical protein PAPHI01_1152 [Pancytospora philotis]|nr:hypothetical protein PAPHI01_1152 [Pancytospora philotis]
MQRSWVCSCILVVSIAQLTAVFAIYRAGAGLLSHCACPLLRRHVFIYALAEVYAHYFLCDAVLGGSAIIGACGVCVVGISAMITTVDVRSPYFPVTLSTAASAMKYAAAFAVLSICTPAPATHGCPGAHSIKRVLRRLRRQTAVSLSFVWICFFHSTCVVQKSFAAPPLMLPFIGLRVLSTACHVLDTPLFALNAGLHLLLIVYGILAHCNSAASMVKGAVIMVALLTCDWGFAIVERMIPATNRSSLSAAVQ